MTVLQAMDLAGIFTLLLAASGCILLADWAFFKRRRLRGAEGMIVREPLLVEYARSFFPVILIVLLIRAFVIEPFRIPSASMMPGLVAGDFIFVNKFSYGLRLPVTHTKIVRIAEPQRGDVIVFRLPSDPSIHFIKRLIGLPGDHVVVRDNRLMVNGASIPMKPDGAYAGEGHSMGSCSRPIERPPISTPLCPRATISSWATIEMTARTAASRSWASFPNGTWSGTPFEYG